MPRQRDAASAPRTAGRGGQATQRNAGRGGWAARQGASVRAPLTMDTGHERLKTLAGPPDDSAAQTASTRRAGHIALSQQSAVPCR